MTKTEIGLLVVDDDEDLRATLTNYIARMGVRVCSAGDVAEAAKSLRAELPAFDIVLTDLKLPGGSGMEIVRIARECNRDCLVSIVTGYGTLETAIEAIRLGAYDYITKPFSLDEIGIQVRNMVERISLAKENARLSLRLQELYEELNRLQTERVEIANFQDEIRRELKDNRMKLDQLVAALIKDRRGVMPEPHNDRTALSGLMLELDRLERLKSGGSSLLEIEAKRRGLLEEFVDKL